jgi:DNA-binding NarL/FixJ family response regulator
MSQQVLTRQVRVAIHAPDAITRAGLADQLRNDRRLCELPPKRAAEADVTVLAVDTADASTLSLLRTLADRPRARFVLVLGGPWQADVFAAVDRGVRAVLWRNTITPTILTQALLTVAEGGGSFPPTLQGTLMRQVQRTQREILTPHGLTATGVSPRDLDVLRLIAEGEEPAEIAAKLSYSERTVRYVLYGLMKRMNLHNRAHAVSYAIRTGLI